MRTASFDYDWTDIGYKAQVRIPPFTPDKIRVPSGPHYVEVTVWEPINHEDDMLFRGSIKWDGCANFNWTDTVAWHLCGPSAAGDFSIMLERLFDAAKQRLGEAGCYTDFGAPFKTKKQQEGAE